MDSQSLRMRKAVGCAIAAVAGAGPLLMAQTAQAALQDRDLNGDTVTDAIYDTDLDITWLRDAAAFGPGDWDDAMDWAAGFSFAGYNDWRLPMSDACSGYGCTGSEMGHLWYVELGNPAGGPMANVGNFLNFQTDDDFGDYWSVRESGPGQNEPSVFHAHSGYQYPNSDKGYWLYALAVRDGDVAVVPELATCALMLAGLCTLAVARRRQRPV